MTLFAILKKNERTRIVLMGFNLHLLNCFKIKPRLIFFLCVLVYNSISGQTVVLSLGKTPSLSVKNISHSTVVGCCRASIHVTNNPVGGGIEWHKYLSFNKRKYKNKRNTGRKWNKRSWWQSWCRATDARWVIINTKAKKILNCHK